jgi:hypothetical protein
VREFHAGRQPEAAARPGRHRARHRLHHRGRIENDTARLSAVLRSWEDRFATRVIGVGFAELYLSVAAPPTDHAAAFHIAAEHFAFCPDNVWQGSTPDLAGYAGQLVDAPIWSFWWD